MKFIASFLVVLLAVVSAFGGTLGDFKKQITDAREKISALIEETDIGDSSESELLEWQDEIRASLIEPDPKFRRIEFGGSSVEIDFGWIREKFETIKKDPAKRIELLAEIDERLGAILLKIEEIEKAEQVTDTKNADKAKLAEILNRPEFQKPDAPKESWLDRFLQAMQRWLDENFPQIGAPEAPTEGMRSTSVVLQIILYAVVIGAIGFLIYKFAPFLASKFGRSVREDKDDRIILGERIGMNEDAGTLFGEAERLAREGNLRGAIRKGYVALLCDLSDRKLIGLAHYKTNRDYLRDVRKDPPLFRNMNGMTNSFERHWYGFEEVRTEDWDEFRAGYERTLAGGAGKGR